MIPPVRHSLVLLIGALAAGLAAASPSQGAPPAAVGVALAPLRADLERFEAEARQEFGGAVGEIGTIEPGSKAAAAQWEKEFVESLGKALKSEDEGAALVSIWALCAQSHYYLTEGKGKSLFGKGQGAAVGATAGLKERARLLAKRHLRDDAYREQEQKIRELAGSAADKPLETMRGRLGSLMRTPFNAGVRTIQTVVGVPLAPANAASGLQQGAAELHNVGVSAERFTDVFEKFPEKMREQLEILLDRLEKHDETLLKISENLRAAAEAASQTTKAADPLTAKAIDLAGAVDKTAPKVQASAETIGAAADKGAELVKRLEAFMRLMEEQGKADRPAGERPFDPREYAQAAEAIRMGAAEVRSMLDSINTLLEDDGSEMGTTQEPRHHFDVREYTEAARAIHSGAAEIRASLSSLQTLMSDSQTSGSQTAAQMGRALDMTLTRASQESRELVDHIAWRAAQLLALAALLAAGFLAARRARGRPGGSGKG